MRVVDKVNEYITKTLLLFNFNITVRIYGNCLAVFVFVGLL